MSTRKNNRDTAAHTNHTVNFCLYAPSPPRSRAPVTSPLVISPFTCKQKKLHPVIIPYDPPPLLSIQTSFLIPLDGDLSITIDQLIEVVQLEIYSLRVPFC